MASEEESPRRRERPGILEAEVKAVFSHRRVLLRSGSGTMCEIGNPITIADVNCDVLRQTSRKPASNPASAQARLRCGVLQKIHVLDVDRRSQDASACERV